jgi:large subunit ribosomal protein L24e
MPTCSFCKNNYEFPKGTTVVQKDGSVKYYCSSKCKKNLEMGRLSKKVKWIRKSDVIKTEKEKKNIAYQARQETLKPKEEVKINKKKSKSTKK